jgi:flagellar motor switch protein FliM
VSAAQVSRHDFRRTKTLDRFHVHTVGMVLESFARLATTPLSTVLRQPCSLSLISLDQVTWAEVSQTLDNTLHFVTFTLPPVPGSSLLALPIADALAIVDLRLAGSGEGDYPERMLTEIEQELPSPVCSPPSPSSSTTSRTSNSSRSPRPATPRCWRASISRSATGRRAS